MFTRGSSASYKLQNCIASVLHPYISSKLGYTSPSFHHQNTMVKRHGFAMIRGYIMGTRRKLDADIVTINDEKEKASPSAGGGSGSSHPKFNFSLWVKCILGSVLSFFLPLIWQEKWAKFKRIEGEAEMVVEEVENVAEVVEKVATATEKIAAQMAENLPDESKLKKAALMVEHVSEKTAQDAHATTQFIHQVEAIKQDVDGLESLVEPIFNKIVKQQPK